MFMPTDDKDIEKTKKLIKLARYDIWQVNKYLLETFPEKSSALFSNLTFHSVAFDRSMRRLVGAFLFSTVSIEEPISNELGPEEIINEYPEFYEALSQFNEILSIFKVNTETMTTIIERHFADRLKSLEDEEDCRQEGTEILK